jgi:hypothetical protein
MTTRDWPYLSIVITGRNDDFGGDFNGRFLRALRFNLQQLMRAGVSYEVVFVEWRPVEERPYLTTILQSQFPEIGSSHLRCFVVHPAYHDALSQNTRLQFQEFLAKNVGIRRARGTFVLTTNSDVYLSRGVIARLAPRSLEHGVLYRAARYDLKPDRDVGSLDWDVLEDERNYDIINAIRPPLFSNAAGDFLLLDRYTYNRLRGFNEVNRVAKIHIDRNFCVKARCSGVRLVDIGSPVYHVGRGTLHAQLPQYQANPEAAPWGDIRSKREVVYANGPEWGLANAPERRLNAISSFLDFDWKAVGPIVDLKRVVLPGEQRHG